MTDMKYPAAKIIMVIIVLCIVSSGYCFSQTKKTVRNVNSTVKDIGGIYLDKTNPIFIAIKGRAAIDLKKAIERSDPKSAEAKLYAPQIESLTEDQQAQLQKLFQNSINNYIMMTHFFEVDWGLFMLTWGEFKEMDLKRISEEYDIRVHYRDGDRYIAEFFKDGLAKNSEEAALANTSNPERRKIIKERYAIVRKPIQQGKQERYYKEMALLYTLEKDNSLSFLDPFEPMYDFIKKLPKGAK